MSRRRYISTDISIDKAVNKLGSMYSDFAALFYTWMIPHAEDDAMITGDPEELILEVIPGRRDKTVEDVIEALEAMEELQLIFWDRENEVIYLPVKSFYKYQTYIKQDRRRKENPDIKPQRKSAKNTANQRTSPSNADEHHTSPQNAVSIAYHSHNITKHSSNKDTPVLLESTGDTSETQKTAADAFDQITQAFYQVTGKSTLHPSQDDLKAARQLASTGIPPDFILQTMAEIAADTEVSSMKYFLKAIPDRWSKEQDDTGQPSEPPTRRLTREHEEHERKKQMALYHEKHGTTEGFEYVQPS